MQSPIGRLARLAGALALVAGISAVPVAQVAACSCAQVTPEEAAAMVDFAFTGTVVQQEPWDGKGAAVPGVVGDVPMDAPLMAIPVDPMDRGAMLYLFEVDGVAKGSVGPQATVLGGGDGASCGMSFGMNERWLVFATAEGELLTTNLCAGNVLLAEGEEPPIAVTSPGSSSGSQGAGFGVPVAIVLPAAAIAALVGLSAYIFWRADRPI